MRVLFVTTSYPSSEALASGVFVLEHARAASPHAEIGVLHLDRRHDSRGISVTREDSEFPLWHVRYPYRPTAVSIGAHVAAGLMGYRRVRRDGFVPDLVHAHFFLSALPAALFGKPMVETEQWTIFLPEDPAELSTPLRLGARAALSRARLILPVSESLRDAMRAAGVRGEFRVIPNAVDVSLFAPRERPSGARLVSVGMLQFQKGVDDLLQAFAAVRAQRPDATLEIVGDGPDRREYEELARKLDLDGSVTFHGLLPKSRIAGLLSTANLFVLASRFDNNPCVLVEAQAAGLPIVSTRVGGIPEIVGEAGILTERDDSDAFAAAILHALSELGRYDPHEIAAAARSRYSIEQVGLQLADAYRSALS